MIKIKLQRTRFPGAILPVWEARISYNIATGPGTSKGGAFLTPPRFLKGLARLDALDEARKLLKETEDVAFVYHVMTGDDVYAPGLIDVPERRPRRCTWATVGECGPVGCDGCQHGGAGAAQDILDAAEEIGVALDCSDDCFEPIVSGPAPGVLDDRHDGGQP